MSSDSISSPSPSSRRSKMRKSQSVLMSTQMWDIYAPPPTNSLQGVMVPRALVKRRKRRKIAIEMHRVEAPKSRSNNITTNTNTGSPSVKKKVQIKEGNDTDTDMAYEEVILKILEPMTKSAHDSSRNRAKTAVSVDTDTHDVGSMAATEVDGGADDADSVNVLDPKSAAFAPAAYDEDGDWKTKYRLPISALTIKGQQKSGVFVELLYGKLHQTREFIFDSIKEAEDFQRIVEHHLEREKERADKKYNAIMNEMTVSEEGAESEQLNILVEIVSGWDLPAGDMSSSDPYVECFFGGEKIHQTDYISKTLDPIWTVKTRSLFLVSTSVSKLFRSDGLLLQVMDFDKVGDDEALGAVIVQPKELYDGKGERLELKLILPPGHFGPQPTGYLAVRCRRASDYDLKFMNAYTKGGKDGLVAEDSEFRQVNDLGTNIKGGAGNIKSILSKTTKMVKTDEHPEGIKMYRIRPEPDPKRPNETTWMTKDNVEKECLKDSQEWLECGSGRRGTVSVEILGCDDLPNLDAGGFAGNKTDAFVCLVFEDTMVCTDIIDDCLSPRWLPWSKRAFIFNIYHSSSQLFLGVFDHDASSAADDHDLVGRVSLDLSNLRKNTIYTLRYNIYTTAKMSQRKSKGSITVRLRLDIPDERQLLLSALEPPAQMYVNCRTRKEFRVVKYTCTGKYDVERYSMKVINSYIEEILALRNVLFYIEDAFIALVLWRSSTKLSFLGISFSIPVHSIAAFSSAILLVEKIDLIPSFCLFAIAWLLIATMEYRTKQPDVWSRCKSYNELTEVLIRGRSSRPPDSISAYENYEEATAFLEKMKKRLLEAEMKGAEAYKESLKLQEEYAREMEEFGDLDIDISTKNGGISIDPFKPLLFPVQQNLGILCRYIRHVKYVLFWEECYISYWIVTGCLLMGTGFLFVPWKFFIVWGSRIIAWTLFGPWMKLVDIYFVSKVKPLTESQTMTIRESEQESRRLALNVARSEARIRKENAAKLKAMKKYMFGKFITRVPVLKEDRYRDLPLPESTAVPHTPKPVALAELAMKDAGYKCRRLPGQHLVGEMIPKTQTHGFTRAPTGQATTRNNRIERQGSGEIVRMESDSTIAAYAWISALVFTASFVSWFGVPLLSTGTDYALMWISRHISKQ